MKNIKRLPNHNRESLLNLIEDLDETRRQLIRSEKNLSSILENSPDIITLVNLNWKIEFINKTVGDYTVSDTLGTSVFNYISKEKQSLVKSLFEKVVQTGKADSYQVIAPGFHGPKSYWITRVVPLKDDEKVSQLMLINTDVTERKHAEEEIKKLKNFNESIVAESPIVIAVIDRDFVVRAWNKYSEEYVNLKKEDIIGKNFFEAIPPFKKLGWDKIFTEVLKTGNEHKIQGYPIVRTFGPHKGETWYQNVAIAPLREAGKITGIIVTVIDITKQKKAEIALKESEDRYRTLVETSPDAITLTDPVGNFIMVNQQAALLHGFKSPEEMLASGKSAFDLIAPEDSMRAMENVKRTLELGSIRNAEYTLLKKNRTKIPAELSASLMKDVNGKPTGFIGVIRDISEHKKAQESLQIAYADMENQVKARTADLSSTNEKLLNLINECKMVQLALKESEELFRIVTEGALAGVYIVQKNKFKYVNPALAQTFGFKPSEVIEKIGPLELTHPDDHALVSEQLRRRLSGELESVRYTFRGLKKNGLHIYCEVLTRRLEYKGEQAVIGTLIDITEQKKAEDEMKKRLMKFNLVEGTLYLVKESTPLMSVEAFRDLLNIGYRGYVISRTPEEEFKKTFTGDFLFSWLSEKGSNALPPHLDVIEKHIEDLPRKNAILIDRLDYLVIRNGFNSTLEFIQHLRDIAYLTGHIVILSLDASTIGKRSIRLLEKETLEIEALHKEALPEDLLEVLRFINRQNTIGVKPSYTDVVKNLRISKPTVKKRIKLLNSGGYVMESINGRRKSVEISDRGRSVFTK